VVQACFIYFSSIFRLECAAPALEDCIMLRHVAAAIGLVALLAAPVMAAEQEIKAMETGQIEFGTPSGNIGCIYTPEGGTEVYQPANGGPELICERVEPTYVTIILGTEGEPQVIEDPGEQGCCSSEDILAYGNTVDLGGHFTCGVETTGLTCERDDGTGFSMARAGIELLGGDNGGEEEADDEDDHKDTESEED
jgi:hypothetical protein